ncbi:MAG: DMT family transporter [Pseudomonadota bacterium]
MNEASAPYAGLQDRRLAMVLLVIAPAMFASNMLVAKAVADLIPPVALAFGRWSVTFLLLLPFTLPSLWRQRRQVLAEWRDLAMLGALGMGVCGAFVYVGADTTTATNIGLIYAASPILIVVIARIGYREPLSGGQACGVALSLLGVLVVVCRGRWQTLVGFDFTVGDLWIVASAIGWALYSVLLRYRPSELPMMTRFAAAVMMGVMILLPFTLVEAFYGEPARIDGMTIGTMVFLALVVSFGGYQVYGLIQRSLGAGPTGLLMYLIPLYNAGLAYLLLGERLAAYHLVGAVLVLPGIYLATRRAGRLEPAR